MAGGYLAVPSVRKKYGYILQSCKIVGDNSKVDGTYTLGRPWGQGTPIALFIDTEMEVVPSSIGWNEMSNGWPKRFAEYNSHTSNGVAVDLSGRKTTFGDNHPNNPILTAAEAAEHTLAAVMGQDDDWQPALYTEQAPIPANVAVENNVLTWDNSDYALLYAVCKDGNVIGFTTDASFNLSGYGNGDYSVRSANEMGGLSEASTSVTTGISIQTSDVQKTVEAIYSVDGRQQQQLEKGLNIIRMSDGTTRKVLKP